MTATPFHYNFFAAQEHHKRLSLVFYRLFAFVVFCHCVALFIICLGAGYFFDGNALSYWWFALVLLLFYIVIGVLVQRYLLAQGGQALAKKMQAVRLFIDPTSSTTETQFFPTFIRAATINALPSGYARAYEFCEQMSIASGVPMPFLYVLPNESGINAFVAGFEDKDTVMVITQGAIDSLDNESFYALIAHQYSAIIHGDAKLNLRISIMTTGLSWVYECAEWLEVLLLGKFDANYHQTSTANIHPTATLSYKAWVSHWQSPTTTRPKERHYDTDAGAVLLIVPIVVVLLFVRLIGLFGMASHDFIVFRFNRERSFLADATSVQLTRSMGVGQLLMHTYQQSSYLTNPKAQHLGHFFFAQVRRQEEFFDSHPSIDERLDKLGARAYFAQSSQLVRPIDKQALKEAHDSAAAHAPIVALAQEVLIETLAYVGAPADCVVDGRLIVNDEWYDWSENKEDDDNQQSDRSAIISEQQNSTQSIPAKDNHSIPSTIATHCHTDGALATPFELKDAKALALDWEITKHLRAALGTLVVIESIALMRFFDLPCQYRFDLYDIYIKSSLDNFDGLDERTTDKLYPHVVGDGLLNSVAKLDRRVDGVFMVLALRKLKQHLHNAHIPLNSEQTKILKHYYAKLVCLFEQKQDDKPKPINDYQRLLAKINKVIQGAVLAMLIKTLQEALSERLPSLMMSQNFTELSKLNEIEKIQTIFLAFLVSVQDNSFLLGEHDKLSMTLKRLLRLMDIHLSEEINLIGVIEKSHHLSVEQWAQAFLALVALPKRQVFLETLHTACIYDVVLAQKERDLLLILDELF